MFNNISWTTNPHIRMFYEASCDTEDWSNENENSVWEGTSQYATLIIENTIK